MDPGWDCRNLRRPFPMRQTVCPMQSDYSASKMQIAKRAFRFVFTIGIVSLFADMTYEGARGNTGPFLGSLGANATALGLVVGFGELLGYGVRSVSGYFADRTHRFQHWLSSLFCYSSPPCRSSFWQRNTRHPNRKPKTDDRQPTTACRRHAPLTLLYTPTVSTGLLSAKSLPTSTRPPHSKHLCTPQKFPRRSYAGSVLER